MSHADEKVINLEAARDKAKVNAEKAADKTKETADAAGEKLQEGKEKAKEGANAAAEKTKEGANAAADKLKEGKDTLVQKLKDDGVVNPQGLAFAAFGGIFLAAVPVTSWIAQPNGILEKAVNGVCRSVAFVGSAGSNSFVAQTGKIAALSTLYITMTYALTGAGSAAGYESGIEGGRDNNHPRAQTSELKGLPLRLYSAHYNLLEMFGGFGLSAVLAQTMAPGDQTLINLLGLHVIAKCFVYYPAYLFNLGTPRTLAHIAATASVINVALRLSKRPLL